MNALPFNRWVMERSWASTGGGAAGAGRETFTDWFARRRRRPRARGEVVLFHDTFVTYNTPEIGRAAVDLLEAAGYKVVLVDRKCCGRPLISKGMLAEAREHAAWNVARLYPYAARGVANVGLEPSCLLTLGDEYVDLLRTDEARTVARQSALLEQSAARARARVDAVVQGRRARRCSTATVTRRRSSARRRRWRLEVGWLHRDRGGFGCCGMAGSFGFEREHYDVSVSLGNRRLAPAVKAAPAATEVVAPGISCRQQIQHLAGRRAKHPAEALWEALAR